MLKVISGFITFLSISVFAQSSLTVSATPTNFASNHFGVSCHEWYTGNPVETDLQPISIEIPEVAITNDTSDNFVLAYIEVKFQSADILSGVKTYSMSGDSLNFTFSPKGKPVILQPGQSVGNSCGLRMGGLAVKDNSKTASGTGEISVYGYSDGAKPNKVFGTTTFKWEYQP
jgi:hypothetical protein